MRVYFIDPPTVSSGLRRTYHKKLEVYSGELKGDLYKLAGRREVGVLVDFK